MTSTAASNNNTFRDQLNVNAMKPPISPARPTSTYRISTIINPSHIQHLNSRQHAASRRGYRGTSGTSIVSMRTPNGGDKSKNVIHLLLNERGRYLVFPLIFFSSAIGATPPIPVVNPKNLSPVPRPGSIDSSVSSGSTSTGSNSTFKKVIRTVVLQKKSSVVLAERVVEMDVVDMEDVKEDVKEELRVRARSRLRVVKSVCHVENRAGK